MAWLPNIDESWGLLHLAPVQTESAGGVLANPEQAGWHLGRLSGPKATHCRSDLSFSGMGSPRSLE
jgi:hypothetical protein